MPIGIVDSTGNNAGSMAITDSTNTYLQTAGSGRQCIWGGMYGDTVFYCTFKWTAPLSGEVSIYTAGVVNDGPIGGAQGYVYTDSIVHLKAGNLNGSTGTDDSKLQLFPNPAHNFVQFGLTAETTKFVKYTITDVAGQVVKTGNTYAGIINTADLPAGMFYLQCGIQTPKAFIKQ
jgi:hypothetical protein